MKQFFLGLVLFCFLAIPAIAQNDIDPNQISIFDNGPYNKQAVQERTVIPWPALREADIYWSRRIERIVDPREKQNRVITWVNNPLNEILYNAVVQNKLNAYSTDSLKIPFTPEEAVKVGSYETVIQVPYDPTDPNSEMKDSNVTETMRPDKILGYKLIEDWIFDKKTSEMVVRIIAIAPMYRKNRGSLGEDDKLSELFYIKYEDLRRILINQPLFNRENDAMRLTYDDFFEQRLFSSYIVKQSNFDNIKISQYTEFENDALGTLLEADRIKNELFEKEHDLWEY